MGNAYIVDACRTPRGIGKVGKGALAPLHPSYLGSTVLAAMAAHTHDRTLQRHGCVVIGQRDNNRGHHNVVGP